MKQRKFQRSKKNSGDGFLSSDLFNYGLALTMIVFMIVGSQSFLSSYPQTVVLNDLTKFGEDIKGTLSGNQIMIKGNQIQTNSGDALPLPNGGYLKFKANQSQFAYTEADALKYGNFGINHIALLTQELVDWDMELYNVNLHSSSLGGHVQNVNMSFNALGDILRVDTPDTTYFVKYLDGTFIYITTDDNKHLYKLARTGTISELELIGYYDTDDEIKVKLMER